MNLRTILFLQGNDSLIKRERIRTGRKNMRVLHYSLGFPPYRSGGLIKFCMDLMACQAERGYDVALMWPGRILIIDKRIRVKRRKNEEYKGCEIKSYEVVNPLPVPYDEGIKDIDAFIAEGDYLEYKSFLESFKPDAVHIHTLMGMHKAFLRAAKDLGIKLVFTTHDFFPICPKVTIFRKGQICQSVGDFNECSECNLSALPMSKVFLLQSPIYKNLKDAKIVKKLRKKHRDAYLSEKCIESGKEFAGNSDDYRILRKHYHDMLELIDIFHYNSSVAKNIYEKYLGTFNGHVIPISHKDIQDHRRYKTFDDVIRIRYLGPYGGAKGFFYLKETLDKLWKEKKNFILNIHFSMCDKLPYIREHDRYDYSDLERIFSETDVLIVPSIWYETFGFTVLEALSYGVPVIISSTVGAKDVLADGTGIVVDYSLGQDELFNELKALDKKKLQLMNKTIVDKQVIYTLDKTADQIEKCCYV